MFQRKRKSNLQPKDQSTPLAQVRRRFMFVAAGVLVFSGSATIGSATGLLDDRSFDPVLLRDGILWLLIGLVVYGLLRRGLVESAAYALVAGLTGIMLLTSFIDITLVTALLAILFAALLIRQDVVLYAVLALVSYSYIDQWFAWREQYAALTLTERPLSPISIGVIYVAAGLILRRFVRAAEREAANMQRAAELLEVTSEVGQITSTLLDLDELFAQTVDMIRDRFGYYHVQVFMVDEDREFANLVASTGEAGRELLARKHKLAVGSQSVIGRVTLTGEVVIVRNTQLSSVHSRNEQLLSTQAEMALPIMDSGQIIGALDVQSVYYNAFTETDVKALEVLTNQLATAVRNARLFELEATRSEENKRLFIETEANLAEIQRLNQQLTGDAWDSYMRTRGGSRGVTLRDETLLPETDWTPTMLEASRRRRAIIPKDTPTVLAVPLVLRGEVIGAIEINFGDGMRPGDALDTLQTIAGRLAISLDNARLYEESQVSSQRQRHINEIVARYQAAPTVEDLLQITVAELSQSLNASTASIRLSGGQLTGLAGDADIPSNGTNGHHTNGNGSRAHNGNGAPHSAHRPDDET